MSSSTTAAGEQQQQQLHGKELVKRLAKVNLKRQSVVVDEANRVRRNASYPDALVEFLNPEQKTLYSLFQVSVKKYPSNPCLGTRKKKGTASAPAPASSSSGKPATAVDDAGPYVFKTYKEVATLVNHFGAGLRKLGLNPGDKLAIYSKNREEWVIAEQGCNAHSIITVAIYDTFGDDSIKYVLNHAGITHILCSTAESSKKIYELARGTDGAPNLSHIIQMDPISEQQRTAINETWETKSAAIPKTTIDTEAEEETIAMKEEDPENAKNIELFSFDDILHLGKEIPVEHTPPKPEDLAVIMYTSGTTGNPKGVMLTHRSMVATTAAVLSILGGINTNDVYISYLPLAHIFERETIAGVLGVGASLGFFQGDVTKLVGDILALRPTMMCGVPRVYDRIMAGIRKNVDEQKGFKKWAFAKGFKTRKAEMAKGKDSFLWSKLVFNKIKQRVGGRLRIAVTGGAPISAQTHEFVKVCFGCPIVQGYGLTETCAGATISHPDDPNVGHVGAPIPSVEIKLADVPDMEYFANNNEGEICIRGPSVSSGYYREPEKTAEDFDSEGWFHTGDVGQWQPDGTLKIIDRKKNMFKLSQGEYVAAEKLELVFQQSRFISQVWVYGDSLKSVLVGFIVPNLDYCKTRAASNNTTFDLQNYKTDDALRKTIFEDLIAVGKANKLMGFEFLKAIKLVDEFTLADDLITPTFKIKRPQLKKRYQKEIDDMYTQLDATAPQ